MIVEAARAGDAGAVRLLDREGHYLAVAVLIAARLIDPARIVLGGGLAEAGAPLFEALWDNLARLRPGGPEPRQYVVPAALGAAAGAAGAAALILRPEPGFVAAGLIAG
jgi:glucokinase